MSSVESGCFSDDTVDYDNMKWLLGAKKYFLLPMLFKMNNPKYEIPIQYGDFINISKLLYEDHVAYVTPQPLVPE